MTFLRHCTLRWLWPRPHRPALLGQAGGQVEPIPGDAMFTVFIRGTDVGQEQVALVRSGSQWIISSTGRLGDFTLNRFEVKAPPTGSQLRCTSKARKPENLATKARRRSSSDVLRPHQRDQRDYPERRDQLEDRSDFRAQRRPADQRLRRLRGARGTARQRQCRNRAPNLRGSRGRSQGERQGNFGRSGDDARRHRQDTKCSSSFMAGTARARRSR